MNLSALAGVLASIIGAAYTIQAFLLPNATVGKPLAPKLFPLGLGIIMIISGIALAIIEVKKNGFNSEEQKKTKDENLKSIIYTCVNCIIYALLINRIGYVLSTITFLLLNLTLFNGKSKWKVNTIVSVGFSLFIYVVFSKLLGIILPPMPF